MSLLERVRAAPNHIKSYVKNMAKAIMMVLLAITRIVQPIYQKK